MAVIAICGQHGHPLHLWWHQQDSQGKLVDPRVSAPRIPCARVWKPDDEDTVFPEHMLQTQTFLLASPFRMNALACSSVLVPHYFDDVCFMIYCERRAALP